MSQWVPSKTSENQHNSPSSNDNSLNLKHDEKIVQWVPTTGAKLISYQLKDEATGSLKPPEIIAAKIIIKAKIGDPDIKLNTGP